MTKEKESGLTKLIELLNKHRVELAHGNIQNQPMRHYNGYVFGLGDLNSQNCVLLIISKEYGFIKWLVENEKIEEGNFFYNTGDLPDDDVSKLLMLLSIQDEPINFLLEILK